MEKLELKHLAGYLPYGLKIQHKYTKARHNGENNLRLLTIELEPIFLPRANECYQWIPILRPLSNLTKEIEVNGEKFVPLTELLRLSNFTVDRMPFEEQCVYLNVYNEILFLNFNDAQKLLEWHFDLFSLIENNLAININDIK